jgi:hypothetical protein
MKKAGSNSTNYAGLVSIPASKATKQSLSVVKIINRKGVHNHAICNIKIQ